MSESSGDRPDGLGVMGGHPPSTSPTRLRGRGYNRTAPRTKAFAASEEASGLPLAC